MGAGGAKPNSNFNNASTGWDSLNYWTNVNADALTAPAVTGGYSDLTKSQSWTAQFSSTFNTWYFGSGVTVANAFSSNPIWYFRFSRGTTFGNGESYTAAITVISAEITYTSL